MTRPTTLTFTLLTLAAVAGLGLRPTSSETPVLAAAARVYLPVVLCPTCAGALPTPEPSPIPIDVLEARMVELVNQARLAAGCPKATLSATLMQATGDWSEYMRANNIGEHTPSDWYTAPPYLYPTNAVLENIAGGSDSADYVFDGWMASALHKRNLEFCYHPDNPSYDPAVFYEIGVGYSGGYWTLAIADRAP